MFTQGVDGAGGVGVFQITFIPPGHLLMRRDF
jgi:hypothetical protein